MGLQNNRRSNVRIDRTNSCRSKRILSEEIPTLLGVCETLGQNNPLIRGAVHWAEGILWSAGLTSY